MSPHGPLSLGLPSSPRLCSPSPSAFLSTEPRAEDRAPGPTLPMPASAALGLLASAIRRDLSPSFYWRDHRDTYIGLGEWDVVEAAGPHRLLDLNRQLTQRAVNESSLTGTRWFGGFSFEPEVHSPFHAFGAARFVCPRVLWHWHHDDDHARLQGAAGISEVELERARAWARETVVDPQPLSGGSRVDLGSRPHWDLAMARARRAFDHLEVRKVVLSRDVLVHRSHEYCPSQVLAGLPARSPAEASFAFFADGACFLGLTPERLVEVEPGRIRTEALAGSSSADDPDGLYLLHSPKDLDEQRYVVEHVRQALLPLVEDILVPERPSVRRLGTIAHLCTQIEARLNAPSPLTMANVLHPTPAVGGVPTAAACSVLAQAEGRPRGWYAGGIGWLEAGPDGPCRGDVRVALRSALVEGCRARVFVGAGIVPSSTADGEWAETTLKASRTLAALGA